MSPKGRFYSDGPQPSGCINVLSLGAFDILRRVGLSRAPLSSNTESDLDTNVVRALMQPKGRVRRRCNNGPVFSSLSCRSNLSMKLHSHGNRLNRLISITVWLGLAAAPVLQASGTTTLHYWTGASATSGNWSTGANWAGGVAPTGGDQRLIFMANAARKVNTNNFASGTPFESIWVVDDGYNIYGNAVRVNYLRGRCPAGTSTIFRPDILASGPLQILCETNNSTFHVLGDISLGANDLTFPNFANP